MKKEQEKIQGEEQMAIAGRVGKAKKDFVIHQNEVHIEIKKGDEISEKKIPKKYWDNLRTEGVI